MVLRLNSEGATLNALLTCKVFYIHISSLADELLDAAHLAADGCPVQPCFTPLIPLIHFVFGF